MSFVSDNKRVWAPDGREGFRLGRVVDIGSETISVELFEPKGKVGILQVSVELVLVLSFSRSLWYFNSFLVLSAVTQRSKCIFNCSNGNIETIHTFDTCEAFFFVRFKNVNEKSDRVIDGRGVSCNSLLTRNI